MPNNQSSERRGVSLGELITASLVVIGAVLSFWVSTNVRLSALEIRVSQQEKTSDNVNNKLDKLQEGLNDIRVLLESKQDRPSFSPSK